MASQKSCSGILGIERSPKLLAIPFVIIRGACLTKEQGEGGDSSVGIDYNKLDVSILDRAPVPLRPCVTAHSGEGSLFKWGERNESKSTVFCGVFFFSSQKLQKFAKPDPGCDKHEPVEQRLGAGQGRMTSHVARTKYLGHSKGIFAILLQNGIQ